MDEAVSFVEKIVVTGSVKQVEDRVASVGGFITGGLVESVSVSGVYQPQIIFFTPFKLIC